MIRAIAFHGFEEFNNTRLAGSFHLSKPNSNGCHDFWYCCPCGCRCVTALVVGREFKPDLVGHATWNLSGPEVSPTLTPSVNHVDHWHGWLRDGYWEVCA